MSNLSNVNLLSEEVSQNLNNESLKNQRIEQTAQSANKPQEENVIQMNPHLQQQQQQQFQQQQQQFQKQQYQQPQPKPQNYSNANNNVDDYDDEEGYDNNDVREYTNIKTDFQSKKNGVSKTSSKDKKILGMKPALFYGLLAVSVAVGGYFAYKYFVKGKKSKGIEPPAPKLDAKPATESIAATATTTTEAAGASVAKAATLGK